MDARIRTLEGMLAQGRDNALLRFGLGSAWMQAGDPAKAAEHLRRALEFDPDYSAAWKLYGKALTALERREEAIAAYETGIERAERKGDMQAVREMQVFLKRLRKSGPA